MELSTQETNGGRDLQQTESPCPPRTPLGVTTIGARRGTEIMETQEAQTVEQLQGKEVQRLSLRINIKMDRQAVPT